MSVGGFLSDWRHGTNAAPTSLTDFSAKTKGVDGSFEKDMVENTKFLQTARTYVAGLSNSNFSVEYEYDATIYGQMTLIYSNGTAVDFQYSPNGTVAGQPKMTGAALMQSVGLPVAVGELIVMNIEYQVSGDVVFTTH